MTLEDWLNSYTANGDAQFVCAWRKRAWRTLRPVVEQFVADRAAGLGRMAPDLMVAIEAARHAAKINDESKRWKQELFTLSQIIRGMRELWPAPAQGDRETWPVAIDLVEVGRFAEAIALVAAQMPNALSRKCPACSQPNGQRCAEIDLDVERNPDGTLKLTPQAHALKDAGERAHPRTRIVPHEARLQ